MADANNTTEPVMWALVIDADDAECARIEARLRAVLAERGSADDLCVRPAVAHREASGLYRSAVVHGRDVTPLGEEIHGMIAGWVLFSEPGARMHARWLEMGRS